MGGGQSADCSSCSSFSSSSCSSSPSIMVTIPAEDSRNDGNSDNVLDSIEEDGIALHDAAAIAAAGGGGSCCWDHDDDHDAGDTTSEEDADAGGDSLADRPPGEGILRRMLPARRIRSIVGSTC